MTWTAAFIERLEERTRHAWRWYIERYAIDGEPGATFRLGSHPGLNADHVCLVDFMPLSSRVDPRSWSTQFGEWSFRVAGDSRASGLEFLKYLTRGTVIAVYVGTEDMDVTDFQRVALGQIRNVTGLPPIWTVSVMDLLRVMEERLERGYGLTRIFSGVPNQVAVAATYAPGDSSLEVVSSPAALERETGGTGMLRCVPSGGGDPFYLTYTSTGTTPYRFLGLSTTDIYDTTQATLAAGDIVYEVAYVEADHPINLVRKLLCSTGTGANGPWDDLPSGWGLALPNLLMDQTWIDDEVALLQPASGAYDVVLWAEEAQEDAWTVMYSNFLQKFGMFPAMRQGRVVLRGAWTPAQAVSVMTLDDDDILHVVSWTAWDEYHSPELQTYTVRAAGFSGTPSAGTTDAATLPAELNAEIRLDAFVWANGAAIADEVAARIEHAMLRVPEVLVVQVGLVAAQLAVGDWITLSTRRAHSRRDTVLGFDQRLAWVHRMVTHWLDGVVELHLMVYPDDEAVYG